MLLVLSKSVSDDRGGRDQKSDHKRAQADGDNALGLIFEDLIAGGGVASQWTDEERAAVGAVYQDRLFPHLKTGYELRCAVRAFDERRVALGQPAVADRLTLALIDAQCFPGVPPRGGNWDTTGTSSWTQWVDKFMGTPVVLERLLDVPQSATTFLASFYPPGTGVGMPTGWASVMGSGDATGWAWIVRNAPAASVRLFLEAGAFSEAMDKKKRPVLAYTHTPESAQVLMDAGADPLRMALPRETRVANLRALWEGWAILLHWHVDDPKKNPKTKNLLAHIRLGVSQWPKQDVVDGLNDVAFEAHVRTHARSGGAPRMTKLLADIMGTAVSWDSPIVMGADRVPYDVAWATRHVAGDGYAYHEKLPDLSWCTASHTLLPNGATVGALRTWVDAVQGKDFSVAHVCAHPQGMNDLGAAAAFVLAHKTTEVLDDGCRVVRMCQAMLDDRVGACVQGTKAQAAFVEAYLSFVHGPLVAKRYDPRCGTSVPPTWAVRPVAEWMRTCPDQGDVVQRGIWGCRVLSSVGKADDSELATATRDAVRLAVVRAAQANTPRLAEEAGAQWDTARASDPELAGMVAAATQHGHLARVVVGGRSKTKPPRM